MSCLFRLGTKKVEMKAKMKTSPSSSCSSSSSSSSCVGSDSSPHQQQQRPDKPKTKKAKTDKNYSDKCQNANATSPNAGRRSSIYRGVTRHRWTGRFEAHLWDKSSWNSIQNKKGKQVYLGAYDSEEAAARTYDLAALKYWGPDTTLNFPIDTYTTEIQEMAKVSKEEYLASLRRRSSGFSRGVSKYRGVARHHHNGRWEARIGRVFGNKYLYLGTYNTQEEAAAAYDMAAIEYRGANAVTNFDISNYIDRLQKKGILPPSLANQTQTQNPTPNSSVKSEEAEPEVKQQQQDQQLQYSQFPQCMDSATVVDSNELAWSFCVDPGFTPFLDPDFSLDKPLELPDLFADIGFEDNIDMIFDAGCGADGVGVSGNMEDNIKERSSSSSSESDTTMLSSSTGASPSSSSTTTSISC